MARHRRHARVVLAEPDVLVDLPQHGSRQIVAAADGAEANVLIEDLSAFLDQILLEQDHEEIEFGLAAASSSRC